MAENETPADRVRAAVKDKAPKVLCEVLALDVAELCEVTPDDNHTETTLGLAKGAAGAMGPQRKASVTILTEARHLNELLAAAGAA